MIELSQSQPIAFILATVLCYWITPFIKSRAELLPSRQDDKDREFINSQITISRLGGIGILLSMIITTAIFLACYGRYTPSGIPHLELEAIAVGAIIIFIIGLLDDLQPLAPSTKLGGQILAASISFFMGIRIEFLVNPIHYVDHARAAFFPLDDCFSYIVTVIFLVAIANAINLIDGIDGLAVGTCMLCGIASWVLNLSPLLNQPAAAILSATMAGACFGFLRYNFNPARIFLGDNGSYLLGFILGCISTIGLTKQITVVVISPILFLIFILPIIDLIYAIFRRAAAQKPIMKPDLGHIHHILLKRGLSAKQIDYLLYSITFIASLIGTYSLGREIGTQFLLISSLVLSAWLIFSLIINSKRQKTHDTNSN